MLVSPIVSSLKFGTQRGRVWIVEDSPLEAEMARRGLATLHSVEVFSDGATVIERIGNGARPDVLVLDSQLPAVTGTEILRFIRESFDEMALPVLMLTVEAERGFVVEGLAAGANDYLTKPYDIAELLARVSVLVRTSHLHAVQARRARFVALAAEVGSVLARRAHDGDIARTCVAAIARQLDASLVALFTVRYGSVDVETAAGAAASVAASSEELAALAKDVVADGAGRMIKQPTGALAAELGSCCGVAAVPLVVDARTAGVLVVAVGRELPGEEFDALTSLAQLVAFGLDRIRVERERAKLLERELRARSEAEAATRSKDEFLALVSHELRSPLNVILGWSGIVSRDAASIPSVAHGIEVIRRNALLQARLIDDLLDVNRIMAGKLRIDTDVVDLVELVDAVVESVRPNASNAKLSLETRIECETAAMRGDAARIKQVVSNLLANAIKFTPAGGSIVVGVRRAGGWLELYVRDTGRGIEPAFLPSVFERFRQADGSMRRRTGGLGLGLSIVRHLVELHGGTVSAESEGVGHGATFTVRFPATDAPSQPLVADEIEDDEDALDGIDVVYVDDDRDARDFVERVLRDVGAKVRVADSVHAAQARIDERWPDVVVSDLGMPNEDGFVLARRLQEMRTAGRRLAVIALTAYGELDDQIRSEAAGFDLHLSKPIAPMKLVAAIARLARRQQTQ